MVLYSALSIGKVPLTPLTAPSAPTATQLLPLRPGAAVKLNDVKLAGFIICVAVKPVVPVSPVPPDEEKPIPATPALAVVLKYAFVTLPPVLSPTMPPLRLEPDVNSVKVPFEYTLLTLPKLMPTMPPTEVQPVTLPRA